MRYTLQNERRNPRKPFRKNNSPSSFCSSASLATKQESRQRIVLRALRFDASENWKIRMETSLRENTKKIWIGRYPCLRHDHDHDHDAPKQTRSNRWASRNNFEAHLWMCMTCLCTTLIRLQKETCDWIVILFSYPVPFLTCTQQNKFRVHPYDGLFAMHGIKCYISFVLL